MTYRDQVRAAVNKAMDAQKIDAWVYPTWSNPPRLIGDLNTPGGDNSQFFSPTTGFPAIQVPMGYTRGGRAAGGHHVLRTRVVGADADQVRIRLRAGDASPARAGDDAAASLGGLFMNVIGRGPFAQQPTADGRFTRFFKVGFAPGVRALMRGSC